GAPAARHRPRRRGQDGQGHPGAAPLMRLVFAAATDVGRMRKNNEDSYLSSQPVAAGADGMGGHRAGEVASAIASGGGAGVGGPGAGEVRGAVALAVLARLGAGGQGGNEPAATDDLKQAILRANRRI